MYLILAFLNYKTYRKFDISDPGLKVCFIILVTLAGQIQLSKRNVQNVYYVSSPFKILLVCM